MPGGLGRSHCIVVRSLPASRAYDRLCKGRELPTGARLSKWFGGCLKAWVAAGAPADRIIDSPDWTQEECDRLILMAGHKTLVQIGRALGRTPAAAKRQMYALGIRNRDGAGYLGMTQLARMYGCDAGRVRKLVRTGVLKTRNVRRVRNRLDIDLADITPEIDAVLRKPRVHKPEAKWPHEMIERMIAMREAGMTWHQIGRVLGRNYNAAWRRYELAFARRPKWLAVWYVVKEFGGRAAGIDVVRVLQSRGHSTKYSELAGLAASHPEKLAYRNGVLSVVRWTSARVGRTSGQRGLPSGHDDHRQLHPGILSSPASWALPHLCSVPPEAQPRLHRLVVRE